MPPAPIPKDESLRLADLRSFDILDTVAEEAYDAITYLAAQLCDAPIALISIVDEQKQREVEVATAQRDSFMATVSHELRGPLTAVIGYVELLRAGLPDDERSEVLASVAREAADVEYLIEDLLASARAEADSLRVASVPVRLDAQIAQVLEGLDPVPSPQSISRSETAGPSATRPGSARLSATSSRTPSATAGRRSPSRLTSRWPMMEPGYRRRIVASFFEPFKQAAGAHHVAASVGLGLPISRLLAEKMGGTLTYGFENGRSVFDLALPAYVG